ncbi:MAG: hypothetical protein ACM3UW_08860 [Bacillota bacterium]
MEKSFWVTGRDNEVSCHLFVYNLVDQHLKPVWMSSALDPPVKNLKIKDTDGDGRNEPVVTDCHHRRPWFSGRGVTSTSEVTTWQWQDWGFYRVK